MKKIMYMVKYKEIELRADPDRMVDGLHPTFVDKMKLFDEENYKDAVKFIYEMIIKEGTSFEANWIEVEINPEV